MSDERRINPAYCTSELRIDYPHVGLYDVSKREIWIARRRWGVDPIRVSHARLLQGGSNTASTADKDRFVCFWCHTPGTGHGYVQGFPIEWQEAHLLIRLDPNWSYSAGQFIPNTDTARIEKNIDQQYAWGQKIFQAYQHLQPAFPLSWHMIGPRPTDSMFYIERVEPRS